MASLSAPRLRSKPVRTCRLLTPPDGAIPGILDVDMGKQLFSYFLTPLPSDFGRAFELRRYNPADGETYHVNLGADPTEHLCDCMGFLRWSHCKHISSLVELTEGGAL